MKLPAAEKQGGINQETLLLFAPQQGISLGQKGGEPAGWQVVNTTGYPEAPGIRDQFGKFISFLKPES